jgi:hypothetical protein
MLVCSPAAQEECRSLTSLRLGTDEGGLPYSLFPALECLSAKLKPLEVPMLAGLQRLRDLRLSVVVYDQPEQLLAPLVKLQGLTVLELNLSVSFSGSVEEMAAALRPVAHVVTALSLDASFGLHYQMWSDPDITSACLESGDRALAVVASCPRLAELTLNSVFFNEAGARELAEGAPALRTLTPDSGVTSMQVPAMWRQLLWLLRALRPAVKVDVSGIWLGDQLVARQQERDADIKSAASTSSVGAAELSAALPLLEGGRLIVRDVGHRGSTLFDLQHRSAASLSNEAALRKLRNVELRAAPAQPPLFAASYSYRTSDPFNPIAFTALPAFEWT